MNTAAADTVLYSAVLRPHRSAGLRTVRTVAIGVGVLWAIVGLGFALAGAWPILPFLGAEILLLIGALLLSQRTGEAYEAISLTERALTIRRVDHWGRRTSTSFQPQWLQVNLKEPPDRTTPLELRSHGRSLIVGSFLLPEERLHLAHALRRELHRLTRARRSG